MSVTYQGLGVHPVGTMTCDRPRCASTFHDGIAETDGPLIHMRAAAAGWSSERPNAYQQIDACPRCTAGPDAWPRPPYPDDGRSPADDVRDGLAAPWAVDELGGANDIG